MNSRKNALMLLTGLFCLLMSVQSFAASPEFGKATYYSDKFQGKKTANGERYDKEKFTCAHKSLKFGTIVRITRLDNSASVETRVNDRGPFAKGYVIDLSRAAAQKIGLLKVGVLKVKIEIIEPEVKATPADLPKEEAKPVDSTHKSNLSASAAGTPMLPELVGNNESIVGQRSLARDGNKTTSNTPESTPVKAPAIGTALYQVSVNKATPKGFAVQLFSLTTFEAALKESEKLQANFKDKVLLQTYSDGTCKILVGPCETRKEADALQKTATKKGHPKCYVVNLEADGANAPVQTQTVKEKEPSKTTAKDLVKDKSAVKTTTKELVKDKVKTAKN